MFPKIIRKHKKKYIVFCNLSTKRQSHGIYSVLWPCTVACTVPCTVRALYVHCAKHSLCNSASGGVEAHSLFVGSSCEGERVFGLGLWHVQKGICSSLRLHSHKPKKNLVLLCLLGSSFEDESVFGLRLWQVQKVVCSSLCLHIRTVNQKIFPGLSPGSSKKTAILSNSLRRNLHAPFPPIQCCYIALLRKAFKKNSHFGSDAGMHWATTLIKGARGDQV